MKQGNKTVFNVVLWLSLVQMSTYYSSLDKKQKTFPLMNKTLNK